MCAVPHHSAANYIAKLVHNGRCDLRTTEDASKKKSWCGREVVRS